MGLDMYLNRKHYVKNWDFLKPEERFEITVKKGGKTFEAVKPERISYIEEQVGYWRKANAIHRWFVDNVQDGKDDCGDYYVDREKLVELRDLCVQVLKKTELIPAIADPSIAAELLPTASGFFFGSTEYDQYYSQDIRETAEMLTALLAEPEGGDFYYHSSW